MGRVDGLINNSHLGDETTVEDVQRGAGVVSEAAGLLGLPVIATSLPRRLLKKLVPLTVWVTPFALWSGSCPGPSGRQC